MRPSLVRSNSAPQCSSSRTRSGDSWAWSWAMRQWLRNEPPFMVSLKWVSQPSCGSTLASAAATPHSAITVWALPSRDFVTSPPEHPNSATSIAARSPAPPAPITSTSCSWVWNDSIASSCSGGRLGAVWHCGHVEELCEGDEQWIVDHAHRAHAHVEVGETDRQQAPPRPRHGVLVWPAHHAPGLAVRAAAVPAPDA